MNSANTMKLSDWAKQNQFAPELVMKLLSASGVRANTLISQVTVDALEAIRPQVAAEQEKQDKRNHAKKAPPPPAGIIRTATVQGSVRAPAHVEPPKDAGKAKFGTAVLKKRPTPAEMPVEIKPQVQPAPHVEPVVAHVALETPVVHHEEPKVVEHVPHVATHVATHEEVKPAPAVKHEPKHEAKAEQPKPATEATAEAVAPTAEPAPRATAAMKATISGPTPEMLARIQKTQQQQAAARRPYQGNRPGGPNQQGYSGSLGRSPQGGPIGGPGAGPGGPNRGPGVGPGGPGRGPGGPGGPGRGPGPGNRFGNTMQDVLVGAGFESPKPGAGAPASGRHGKGKKPGTPAKGKGKAEQARDQVEFTRQSVNRVMASLSKTPLKKTYRKDAGERGPSEDRRTLKTSDFITVGELAGLMEQMPAKVIAKCMEMGLMVTINQRLDFESIQVLADEFGFDAQLMEEYEEENLSQGEVDKAEDLIHRSPIVTVMGHVDHGKTSLLDYIRKANVVSGESGGITQHIGAYEVVTPAGNVTFLDTPGHEAFTAMRARGSQVTDVIVLVVASDSQVMPQTIEVIELAKTSKVPLVVAITKCDLPTSNPDKIRADLANRGVEVEQWGGSTSCVEVSARTGANIDKLLETLALETEVLDLKANPNANARGTVIESRLDAGKGAMATILVQNGTLRVGDVFVCGNSSGRVRAMYDEKGKPRKEAGPSVPAVVIGFDETPQAGDDLVMFEDEKTAREIASKRRMAARERELRARKHMSLEQVFDRKQSGEFSELNLIVKADVDGSAEAIAASLERLTNKEVKINIIRKAVGAIKEDDIMLASSADAVIIAFHLMPSATIRDLAEREGIEIRTYRIIYEIIEEIQGVVEGMLKPVMKEEVSGQAEIREVFKIPKVGIIAGCMVKEGAVDRESNVRVYREGVEVGITIVQSLKRHKDDAKEVKAGLECGIGLKGYENLEAGDVLVFFKEVSVARTLADVEADAAKAAAAKLDAKKKKEQ